MVKNRVMLSGLFVVGLMNVQAHANEYVDKAKAPLAFFAGASAARNSVEWMLGKRRAGLGCPLAGRVVQDRSETAETARMLRVGSYGLGIRTPKSATTWGETVKGLRPAVDGFTLSNVAKDALLAAVALYAVQNGYVPTIPCPFAKR